MNENADHFACTLTLAFDAETVSLILTDGAEIQRHRVVRGLPPNSKLIDARVGEGKLHLTFGCEVDAPLVSHILGFEPIA
jgi:hypothetical protein